MPNIKSVRNIVRVRDLRNVIRILRLCVGSDRSQSIIAMAVPLHILAIKKETPLFEGASWQKVVLRPFMNAPLPSTSCTISGASFKITGALKAIVGSDGFHPCCGPSSRQNACGRCDRARDARLRSGRRSRRVRNSLSVQRSGRHTDLARRRSLQRR